MKTELRCRATMHAKLADGLLEIKCRRRSCGAQPGVVVLHRFNIHTGELVDTKRFADPRKEAAHASRQHSAVRSA